MKNYKLYIIGLIALVATMQSCVKDSYLEEVNPNQVSSASYWTNLTESNENLTSVYGGLLNQFLWSIDDEALRSDLGFPKERTNPVNYGYKWHSQTFDNTGKSYSNKWNAIYRVVWRANQVIEGLNNMDETFKSQEAWTKQMGEARFLRGLMHFYAHSNFNNGKIIIRDKIPGSIEEYSKPVSSSEEVIAFFREDLKYAYNNLPDLQEDKTRVSKGTAALVLGKSYLYTEEYDLAIPLLKDVIEGPYGYKLMKGDDVSLLFTHAGDYNAESILEINYSDQHKRLIKTKDEWDEEAYSNRWARYTAPTNLNGGGSNYFVPTSWLTYAYSNEPTNPNDVRNYISGSNVAKSVPLRCAQMIAVVNDEESTYYQGAAAHDVTTFGSTVFSYFKKLTNHDIAGNEDEVLSSSWASGKNVIVYRLADAYLMLAECLAQTNDIDGALSYINANRDRWGLLLLGSDDGTGTYDDVVYTKESLMDYLMYTERPLELGLEGFSERTTDLRRWGVTKERYVELAASEYNLIDYDYTKADGTTGVGNLIQQGPTVDTKLDINKEFNAAAVNFKESLHAYLPLPISETLYNQEVN